MAQPDRLRTTTRASRARTKATIIQALEVSFGAWLDDRAPTLAGALAFSTIFALAPLFVIIMALTSHFVSSDQIQQHLINQASHSVGRESATALQAMVSSARANTKGSTLFGIIGWLTLVGAASGIFLTLQDALNIIWHVEVKKNIPIATVLRERLGALLMVFVMATLLIATFAADAIVAVAVTYVKTNAFVATFGWVLQLGSTVISLAVATAIFAIAFKVLPQTRIAWTHVWEGAFVSALLFVAGQWVIALFLRLAGLDKGYGAAGSILALLMWVYVSAMFLFLGAEIVRFRSRESSCV